MFQRKNASILILSFFVFILVCTILISANLNEKNAETAYANRNFEVASNLYAQAAKILFWRTNLWEKAGIASAQSGNYSQAILYLEKKTPQTEEGWVWLGTAYYQTEAIEQAQKTFENGASATPSARLYRLLASVYREQKKWDLEKDTLTQLLQFDTADAYTHYRLGLLLTLDISDSAVIELNTASTLNLEVASATQTLISALNIAGTQNSQAEKLITIGRALGLVQEWQLATWAFERAIQADVENAQAWAWLGEAKQQIGEDGSVALNRALALNSRDANIRALYALYWNRQADYEKMLAEYQLASVYEPENPAWQVGLGEAHTQLGDLILALGAYQQATNLAPQEDLYWRLLATFCAENSIYVEEIALPAAQQALSLNPQEPANLDTLGYVYFLSSRFANAEIYFLQAIEISASYLPAHLHLAMNYLAQGKRIEAYNSLSYVRDADASGVYATLALKLLGQYFP